MKAYSYIRFSSPEQSKGDSLRRQLDSTRAYCQRENLQLDERLTFRDLAKSAYRGDNIHKGQLKLFLEAIETGRVEKGSCLIVENLDRLSRAQFDDAYDLFRKILKRGIEIVTLTPEKRFTEESLNSPWDIMLALFSFHRAYDESLQKGKRVRAAWSNKRKNAAVKPMTAACPSWLKLNKQTKRFQSIPSHADTVRRIFELSRDGLGNASIAKKFNTEGVPGIGRVKTWHPSTIQKILANRAVLGEFQPCVYVTRGKRVPDGEPIKDYYPRVISDELFDTVRYRQTNRRTAGSGRRGRIIRNLFSHLSKCGFCGASMVSVTKDHRYPEIVCDNARRGLGCKYVSYPYPEFEKSFLTFVGELDLSSFLNPKQGKNPLLEEIETTKAAISQIKIKASNLIVAIESAANPALIAPLRQKFEELQTTLIAKEQNLKELVAKQSNESSPALNIQDLKTLVAQIQDAKAADANEIRMALREAIRACVEKIRVYPYEIIEPEPHKMTWKEKREAKRSGWSLTSNVQRVERGFIVHFKNASETRVVHSHPKNVNYGSEKLGQLKNGFYPVISRTEGAEVEGKTPPSKKR